MPSSVSPTRNARSKHERFSEAGVLSANALLPLNRDGLRADAIPTVEIEYAF